MTCTSPHRHINQMDARSACVTDSTCKHVSSKDGVSKRHQAPFCHNLGQENRISHCRIWNHDTWHSLPQGRHHIPDPKYIAANPQHNRYVWTPGGVQDMRSVRQSITWKGTMSRKLPPCTFHSSQGPVAPSAGPDTSALVCLLCKCSCVPYVVMFWSVAPSSDAALHPWLPYAHCNLFTLFSTNALQNCLVHAHYCCIPPTVAIVLSRKHPLCMERNLEVAAAPKRLTTAATL